MKPCSLISKPYTFSGLKLLFRSPGGEKSQRFDVKDRRVTLAIFHFLMRKT